MNIGQLGNEMQLLEKENPQHTYFNTDVAELDITNQEAVEQYVASHEIDGIVNCAAYTAVDKAEDNEELCSVNEEFCSVLNSIAPAYLAAAIEKRGGWMIQISTDYVFDGTQHTPYVEDDDTCPNSVYGKTKLVGELNVQKLCKQSMITVDDYPYGMAVLYLWQQLCEDDDSSGTREARAGCYLRPDWYTYLCA